MRLLLMRHAKAFPRDEHLFGDDRKRPLSRSGLREHKRVSRVLRRMGITFDHILTSPYDRALETARITRKVYAHEEKLIEVTELADDFSVDELLKKLSTYGPNETLLLVGHEPHMSTLAAALLWPGYPMSVDFKKSAIMSIRFNEHPEKGQGVLEFFLKPKLLKRLHRGGKGRKDGLTEGAIMQEHAKGKGQKADDDEDDEKEDDQD